MLQRFDRHTPLPTVTIIVLTNWDYVNTAAENSQTSSVVQV